MSLFTHAIEDAGHASGITVAIHEEHYAQIRFLPRWRSGERPPTNDCFQSSCNFQPVMNARRCKALIGYSRLDRVQERRQSRN
jgi:hypothetical protein